MTQISECSPTSDQNWKICHKKPHQPKLKAFQCQFLLKKKHVKKCLHKTVKFKTFPQFVCFIITLNTGDRLGNYQKCQDI